MFPTHDAQSVRRSTDDLPRAFAAAAAAIALTGLFIAGLAFATSNSASTGAPAEAAAPQEVRDGWSSYLGAAAAAPEIDVVDGWSSYLTPKVPPVRDGWSSYLLVPEIDPSSVVDGWMSRYGSRDD